MGNRDAALTAPESRAQFQKCPRAEEAGVPGIPTSRELPFERYHSQEDERETDRLSNLSAFRPGL